MNRSTRARRFHRLGALVIAGSLLAAACGSDSESDADDEATVASAVDADGDTTSDDEPAAGSGGVLKYAPSLALSNLDPDLSSIANDEEWLYPAYDRLVHLTAEGDYLPGLAESWEVSDDSLALTLHIRDGVVFHDGSALTADVVVANLDRSMGLEGSVNASAFGAVESVEAVDESTVQLNLTRPATSLIGTLSARPGMIISGQALADGVNLSETMVGAGMFELTSYRAGDRAVFARFADYWDPDSVQLDGLEIVEVLDPTARLNALRDGQIDATRIDPDGVATLEGDDFNIDQGPTLEIWQVTFRQAEGEPWTDPQVREALAYALDKQGILNAVNQGSGSVVSQMFPPGYFAASPDVADDSKPFDPEKAKQLLTDAGYPDGFTFSVGYNQPDPAFGEAVQASWAQIGVTLEILKQESSELIDNWFAGEFDVLLGPWTGRPDPNLTNDFLYSKDSTFINYVGYDVPRINELLAASEAAVGDERIALLQELSAEVDAVTFGIPVYAPDYIMASNAKVQGLEIATTFKTEFRGVSIAE